MKCLSCGNIYSYESEGLCQHCNFYIGNEAESAYKNQIARLIDMLVRGEIISDNFSNALRNMSSILDEMHRAAISWEEYIPEGSMPDEVRNIVMKPVNVMQEGIEAFSEALEVLGMYSVDPDEEHLVKGLELTRRAHNIMVNSNELAGFALREVKNQMPEGTAPSDEELKAMIENR